MPPHPKPTHHQSFPPSVFPRARLRCAAHTRQVHSTPLLTHAPQPTRHPQLLVQDAVLKWKRAGTRPVQLMGGGSGSSRDSLWQAGWDAAHGGEEAGLLLPERHPQLPQQQAGGSSASPQRSRSFA